MSTLRSILLFPICFLWLSSVGKADSNAFPSGLIPFSSIYYVSAVDANGDQLLEGFVPFESGPDVFRAIQGITPSASNQFFSDASIQLSPGQYFSSVYVPTAAELEGNFSDVDLPIIDPYIGEPFAGNVVPASQLNGLFAFRVKAALAPTEPLNFVPVTACRVADTRNAPGAFGAPALAASVTRTLLIQSSACNIPANASAYSLNITVVPHGRLGYLSVWPSGRPQAAVSTLNSYDGRIKANAAIMAAGTGGAVNFYATDETDLIVDINGYFVPSSTDTGLVFFPLKPCRAADTRNPRGDLAGPFIEAGHSRDFPLLESNCGLPFTARAYALNFTAVPRNGKPLRYIAAWPTGQNQPLVSTLNAKTGLVTANSAIVAGGPEGGISVFAADNTDLVIDVNGYFAPAAIAGLHLYTVDPCRTIDTRTVPYGPFSGALGVGVGGTCGVALNAAAVVVNATVLPVAQFHYLTIWEDGQFQPEVSNLNAPDGAVTSNMAVVESEFGSLFVFATDPTHLLMDVSGYFAP